MLFQFEGVTKTYGSVVALDNLSVSVAAGAVGLLGPNGSGKTTLIRALLGLTRVNRGRGTVLGMNFRTRQLDIRRLVGFVPEDECLFPHVLGVEFVAYAGELVGMSRSDALQRSHEVLDYVGLGEARYRKVESYSTGMKQRLKLGSAIVHDPQLLILDEPTNGMDPAGRDDILKLARDLARHKGMSLLFSSHLLPDVETVCDQVIVLGGGKLLLEGNIRQLKAFHDRCFEVRVKSDAGPFAERLAARGCTVRVGSAQNGFVQVGTPQAGSERTGTALDGDDGMLVEVPEGATQHLLWETAAELGLQIRKLRPQRGTLEEVFLKALEQR